MLSVVCPDTVRVVAVVVASVEVPVTARVPPIVELPVTVEVPRVAVFAARLVITALVVVEFPTTRSVMLARVATRDEMKELVEVALSDVRFVK